MRIGYPVLYQAPSTRSGNSLCVAALHRRMCCPSLYQVCYVVVMALLETLLDVVLHLRTSSPVGRGDVVVL